MPYLILPAVISRLFSLAMMAVLSVIVNTDPLAASISNRSGISIYQALKYSKVIRSYAKVIDPYLIAALIHRESRWNHHAVSKGNYGLMQVRVSRTTNATYLGREKLVLDTRTNIRLGINLLRYWKWFHSKQCKGNDHHWWSHYQWGVVVKDPGSGNRVAREYRRYLKRSSEWIKLNMEKLQVGLTLHGLKLRKRDEA